MKDVSPTIWRKHYGGNNNNVCIKNVLQGVELKKENCNVLKTIFYNGSWDIIFIFFLNIAYIKLTAKARIRPKKVDRMYNNTSTIIV